MILLSEGQNFPPKYRLVRKLKDSAADESWIAVSETTGDRVFVTILKALLSETAWQQTTKRIDALRGLVHLNISLVSAYGEADDCHYMVEPLINAAEPFSSTCNWSTLKQIIEAIDYSHKLGISHGHLHPSNLLVDSEGVVHITGYGKPITATANTTQAAYMSPEIQNQHPADISDDIYSLGGLVFYHLTNMHWADDVQLDVPLAKNIDAIIRRMTSPFPYDRHVELTQLIQVLETQFQQDRQGIATTDFSRQEQPGTAKISAVVAVTTRPGRAISTNRVLIAFAGLILIAVLLFMFLPTAEQAVTATTISTSGNSSLNQETAVQSQINAPSNPIIAPFEAAKLIFMQEQSQKLAKEILRQQVELEDMGVYLWSKQSFEAIGEQLSLTDDLYRDGNFASAQKNYEEIAEKLKDIANAAGDVLYEKIQVGDNALLNGQANLALEAFTIATAISVDDPELHAKLIRADNLSAVLEKMNVGQGQEQNGLLDDALASYLSARKLDGKWQPAQEAVIRTRSAITQREFSNAMSVAFRALSQNNYDLARAQFNKATQILPDSNEPTDGLLQVDQAERANAITEHRLQAELHLSKDEWSEAIDEYSQALAIDNTLVFATAGKRAAERRLDIKMQLLRLLNDPTLMQSDSELINAKKVLADAYRLDAKSDETAQYIDTLARLISSARVETPILIRSDGATMITILRYRALGAFTETEVSLVPGRYTLTGVRKGYRNVRQDLTLINGEPAPVISIQCTEKI